MRFVNEKLHMALATEPIFPGCCGRHNDRCLMYHSNPLSGFQFNLFPMTSIDDRALIKHLLLL